jgi:hypothetical protein
MVIKRDFRTLAPATQAELRRIASYRRILVMA